MGSTFKGSPLFPSDSLVENVYTIESLCLCLNERAACRPFAYSLFYAQRLLLEEELAHESPCLCGSMFLLFYLTYLL